MRDQKAFTYTHIRPLAHTTTSTRVAPRTGVKCPLGNDTGLITTTLWAHIGI